MTTTLVMRSLDVQLIPVEDLHPSPFNPRKSQDPVALEELKHSILEHSVQVPLMVRTRFSAAGIEDGFEVIAGGRRHAASILAGLYDVPCFVRELTDEEAAELAIIDNLQREDMPALEEADAYEALRQQLGDAERIAARVGKPIEYVTRRLKLVSLGANARLALAHRLITIDHALLLGRLGIDDQDKFLKWALDRNAGVKTKCDAVVAERIKKAGEKSANNWMGYWEPQSVLELKRQIEQDSGRRLDSAPWSLADPDLVPEMGPCLGCPYNTAHNTALFADLAIEEATCENGTCFESKRAAFVLIQLNSVKGEKLTPKLSWKSSAVLPKTVVNVEYATPGSRVGHLSSVPDLAKVLKYGQWLDVKTGSCLNVVQGVTVDWDDPTHFSRSGAAQRKPGMVLQICITPMCKAHPKAYEGAPAGTVGNGSEQEARRREAMEKTKAAQIEENKLRLAFVSAALDTVKAVPAPALRSLLIQSLPHYDEGLKPFNALIPGVLMIAKTAKVDSLEFIRALALASILDRELQVRMDGYGQHFQDRAELIKKVRGLGYAGPDPWAKPVVKKAAKKAAAKKDGPVKKAPAKKVAAKKIAAKKAKAK